MRRRPLLALVAALGLGASALACSSSDGRELPAPRVAQTTTTPSAPIVQPPVGSVDVFSLVSSSFEDGTELPARLTCQGQGLSPALTWSGAPLDTSSLAIVVRDLSAGGFVHWVVTDIDPFVLGVAEGGLPENAVESPNGTGSTGWYPPCPPDGDGVHTYEIALLALNQPASIVVDTPAEQAAATLESTAIERAVLTGTVTPG